MRTSETTKDLLAALLQARRKFKPVVKDSTAQISQSRAYLYADLNGLLEATMPALLEHNLVVMQAVDAETSTLITRLAHADSDQWVESAYPLTLDAPPQALGSAVTYGRRYSLQALLNVAATDDDGQAAQDTATSSTAPRPRAKAGKLITPDQVTRLWTVADRKSWNRDRVKVWLIETYHVSSSKEIRQRDYDAIIAHLERGPAPADRRPDDDPAL